MTIAAISYLAAALAFLVLAALVVLRWRNRPGSIWVLGAVLVSLAWALFLVLISRQLPDSVGVSAGILEVARNAAWFAVLLSLLVFSNEGNRLKSRSLRLWIVITAAFLLAVSIPLALSGWVADGRWHGIPILLMAIAGLVLVEQSYRNTPPQRRQGIKFLALGLGAMFAFDLFLFADLILFQALEGPPWQARGFVNALVAPLIGISLSRRAPQGSGPVVSRQLLFHTTALIGAAAYLLAVGGVGYYLRQFGGEIGVLLQVTFLFAAALILALVLFSGTFRARLRVFLSKHFFKYKYDYRQEWLRFTGTLSSEDAGVPFEQRAIQALGELVESPGGLLWVRRDDGSFVLDGVTDLGDPDYPPEEPGSPLVEFLERSGWIIELNEYRRRPGLYRGLRLPDWLLDDERLWAVVPLLKGEDLQGFVVLTTPLAPHRINWEARDLLKTAGRQLAVYVALAATREALVEARQFETFHHLTAFLIHDMKNVSAQLSLICANAERHRDNPEFVADAFATVANARDRLERTQAQLRNVQPRQETPRQVIAVQDLLGEIVAGSQTAQPVPALEIREPAEILGDRDALKNLLLHLVRNAQEATPDDGRIQLSLYTHGPWTTILVQDTGSGIDEEFLRRRLFRPFQTTKGNAGMGIGLYEARDRILRMGGRIDVQSKVGEGTLFTLRLPTYQRQPATVDDGERKVTNDG